MQIRIVVFALKLYDFTCQVGGAATRLPAEQLYSRSNRELGFGDLAAKAGRFHPDPFRTRQLSYLTFTTVLRYASSRELVNAASPLSFVELLFCDVRLFCEPIDFSFNSLIETLLSHYLLYLIMPEFGNPFAGMKKDRKLAHEKSVLIWCESDGRRVLRPPRNQSVDAECAGRLQQRRPVWSSAVRKIVPRRGDDRRIAREGRHLRLLEHDERRLVGGFRHELFKGRLRPVRPHGRRIEARRRVFQADSSRSCAR